MSRASRQMRRLDTLRGTTRRHKRPFAWVRCAPCTQVVVRWKVSPIAQGSCLQAGCPAGELAHAIDIRPAILVSLLDQIQFLDLFLIAQPVDTVIHAVK